MIPCTVGILTRNSGATLERALSSVRDFAEIIICDGGSNDQTLSLAQKFNAHVIFQDKKYLDQDGSINDYSGVRNQMLSAAKYDWFLYIDADEYLSQESAQEIYRITSTDASPNEGDAYLLPRKTVIGGKIIQCASVYPSYQMRLFRRSAATGFIKRVHERVALKEGARVAKLQHSQYVPLDLTPREYRDKQRRYLEIEVRRHAGDSFAQWLRGPVRGALRSTLSFAYRHLRVALFCRGTKMPQWVEWSHYWYNWRLIRETGKKFFKR